ncbi:hypothetical protein WDW86_13945 [Bdellovibrionota bacterium FG-2]
MWNKKSITTLTSWTCAGLIILAGLAGASQLSRAANPFADGTTKIVLSQDERDSLLAYAENSKSRLEKAIKDASGKSNEAANAIYLKAI